MKGGCREGDARYARAARIERRGGGGAAGAARHGGRPPTPHELTPLTNSYFIDFTDYV